MYLLCKPDAIRHHWPLFLNKGNKARGFFFFLFVKFIDAAITTEDKEKYEPFLTREGLGYNIN